MDYFPTPHQNKVKHATRRLAKRVVELCGRRASQEIAVNSFRRSKRRFYNDLSVMHRTVHHRGCEQWVTDQFYRLERRLVERINREISFREEIKVLDGYYEYNLKIKRNRPYVRDQGRRSHEYSPSGRNQLNT